MRRERSLARSFMVWVGAEGKDILREVAVTQRRHRVIIMFRRFPELRGRLVDGALTIVASNQGEPWDVVFGRELEAPEPGPAVYASREAMFVDCLFRPFRDWVLTALLGMNCIEFVSHGERTEARLHPDAEVPYRIKWQRQRNRKEREALVYSATQVELRAFDFMKEREIRKLWAEFREPVDYDQLEREALASLGTEGIAYLQGLTREDFTPFNVTEEIERNRKSAD